MPYQLHEPFPSLSSSRPTYMHTGRGGAGNFHRTTANDLSARNPSASVARSSSSTTSSTTSSSSNKNTFLTGRGGAGNVHPLSERALFSFDEELERASRSEQAAAPIYHIGRGGAGNLVGSGRASTSSRASSRKDSSSSEGSDAGAGRRSLEFLRKLGRGSDAGRQ